MIAPKFLNTCSHCCTKLNNITVTLKNKIVLENISLHINCKEILAIIGPNGAGKSTLLKVFFNAVPFKGTVNYKFHGSKTSKPKIGYVPQKFNFPEDSPITVLELLAMGTRIKPIYFGINKSIAQKIDQTLKLVEANHLIKRKITELSGGEIQRVLLAMAMIPTPDILLLDEPASAIDMKGLGLFYKIVDDLRSNYDISIILVTHDLTGIAKYANRMILLDKKIILDGTPKELFMNTALLKSFGPNLWNMAQYPELKIEQI
ncbi:MAG: metal ABC transporter ATP-binding protein [Candidatus Margulisiibacteriota bacterium]|jgi:zinc transport system ATP-binding protein